jgi:hypothetical protein
LQARGRRFEPGMLHLTSGGFDFLPAG